MIIKTPIAARQIFLNIRSVMMALTGLLAFTVSTQAAVIAGNLSGNEQGNASAQDTFWIAQAFTTGNTSFTDLSVSIRGGNSADGSQIFLYSDSGSLPDAQLSSFSTAGFGTTSGTYTMADQNSTTLDPLTTYWIVFAPNTGLNFGLWTQTTSVGDLDGSGAIPDLQASSNDEGLNFSSQNFGDYLKLEVQGTAVPEPSILSLALIGACLLLGYRRRLS